MNLRNDLINIANKYEGPGKVFVEGDKTTSTLISTDKGHLFDIHDTTTGAGYGSNKLAFGFGQEARVKFEGFKQTSTSEQSTRKMASVFTFREQGFAPEAHRVKDVADYINTERELTNRLSGGTKESTSNALKQLHFLAQWMAQLSFQLLDALV